MGQCLLWVENGHSPTSANLILNTVARAEPLTNSALLRSYWLEHLAAREERA